MSDAVPSAAPSAATSADPDSGRVPAIIVWALYVLSIPSVALLVPVGLILAYASRGGSASWVRTHFDSQIALFWKAFWWGVWLAVLSLVGFVLIPLLGLGLVLLWLIGVVGFVVMLWFTIKSLFGLMRAIDGRPQ